MNIYNFVMLEYDHVKRTTMEMICLKQWKILKWWIVLDVIFFLRYAKITRWLFSFHLHIWVQVRIKYKNVAPFNYIIFFHALFFVNFMHVLSCKWQISSPSSFFKHEIATLVPHTWKFSFHFSLESEHTKKLNEFLWLLVLIQRASELLWKIYFS